VKTTGTVRWVAETDCPSETVSTTPGAGRESGRDTRSRISTVASTPSVVVTTSTSSSPVA
jgi:hypothetical protein